VRSLGAKDVPDANKEGRHGSDFGSSTIVCSSQKRAGPSDSWSLGAGRTQLSGESGR
jgi:hypothetical protein